MFGIQPDHRHPAGDFFGGGLGIDYGISTVSRVRAGVIAGINWMTDPGGAQRAQGECATVCVMIAGICRGVYPGLFHHRMGVLLTIAARHQRAGRSLDPARLHFGPVPDSSSATNGGPKEVERRIAALGRGRLIIHPMIRLCAKL
jgi:hypothetical protein